MNNNEQTVEMMLRLNALIRRMDCARDAYKTSHKNTKDAETGKSSLTLFQEDMAAVQSELEALYRDVNNSLSSGHSLKQECNKEAFNEALSIARNKFMERFKDFPITAALLECFVMYLETQLDLVVSGKLKN